MLNLHNRRLGIVGLGYVGLPLAMEFGKHFPTIGFDVKARRIAELRAGRDDTLEVSEQELLLAKHLTFTTQLNDLRRCRVYIVAVPTPIDLYKRPDLSALNAATTSVGSILKRGDVVIYESTVYPGCTEEICVPLLERTSGLTFNREFFVGYSPERINPGDKEHRLATARQVTSGSTPASAASTPGSYPGCARASARACSSCSVRRRSDTGTAVRSSCANNDTRSSSIIHRSRSSCGRWASSGCVIRNACQAATNGAMRAVSCASRRASAGSRATRRAAAFR